MAGSRVEVIMYTAIRSKIHPNAVICRPFVSLSKQEDERLVPEYSNSCRAASEPMNARHARHVIWLTDTRFPHTSYLPTDTRPPSASSPQLHDTLPFLYTNTHDFAIMADNNMPPEEPEPSRGRKRMRNPAEWKKNLGKRRRNMGEAYVSRSTGRQVVQARYSPAG